ncbi:hypothetical protein RQP46_009910 [Phenoliferia psychrophenolica]
MLNLLLFITFAILAHAELGCIAAAAFAYDPSFCSIEGDPAPSLSQYKACAAKSSLYAPAQAKCESVTYHKAAQACDAIWRTCGAANGCASQTEIQYGSCDACDDPWDNCYEGADFQECTCFAENQKKYCSTTATSTPRRPKRELTLSSSTKEATTTSKHSSTTKKPTPTPTCATSTNCKQAIPNNSHRYCSKGTCTFRCNKRFILSKSRKGCVRAGVTKGSRA